MRLDPRRLALVFSPLVPLLALAALTAFSPGADGAFVIRSRLVGGLGYVHLQDVAVYYGMQTALDGRNLVMAGCGQRLDLTLNSRNGYVNGYLVDLGFCPVEDNGSLLLAERDLSLQLDPLLRPWGVPQYPLRTIVIDPGHGGKDPGALGRVTEEKQVALQVGLRLKQLLESRGYTVVMTRDRDVFIELDARGRCRGDLFVSLHCNSSEGPNADGIETYFLAPAGLPKTGDNTVAHGGLPGNRFDGLNVRLAYDLHCHTVYQAQQAADRGLKRARFQVLRQASCPAALVEMGFVSNPAEEQRLINPEYQEALAVGLANGIIAYHGIVAGAR